MGYQLKTGQNYDLLEVMDLCNHYNIRLAVINYKLLILQTVPSKVGSLCLQKTTSRLEALKTDEWALCHANDKIWKNKDFVLQGSYSNSC